MKRAAFFVFLISVMTTGVYADVSGVYHCKSFVFQYQLTPISAASQYTVVTSNYEHPKTFTLDSAHPVFSVNDAVLGFRVIASDKNSSNVTDCSYGLNGIVELNHGKESNCPKIKITVSNDEICYVAIPEYQVK